MNRSKFEFNKHYRLTPPAQLSDGGRDGSYEVVDCEWFATEGPDNTVYLVSPSWRGAPWSLPLGSDNIHSYQQGHLLLRAQIRLYEGGTGWELRPLSADCRGQTEALLDRIRELAQAAARPS